jgi:predicted transcriptional regulator
LNRRKYSALCQVIEGGPPITPEFDELKVRKILTTPLKVKIMDCLRETERVVDVARKLKVPRDTVKPHIRFLSDTFLIEKAENGYRLTGVGEVLLKKIEEVESLMELIEKHGEFFTSHDIFNLPDELLKDLHLLRNCTVHRKDDPFQIREDWYNVAKRSKWLKVVLSVLYPELIRIGISLADGKEIKTIITSDILETAKTQFPELSRELFKIGDFYLCEKVTEFFWVSDKQLTLFLSTDGDFDPLNVLICNCKEGIEWGVRLFDYYLERSVRIEL